MDCLFSTKCLQKLAHLGPTSYQQIARYVTLLEARNYSHSTLYNLVPGLKGFLDRLPPPRQALLLEDLTLTTPTDLDIFVTSARRQGLQPATINCTLSLLTEFFEFLREGGEMLIQPVIRRRHRLSEPKRLPRPIADVDVVKFFKVIDDRRDRLWFLLMLRCGLRVSEACSLLWSAVDLQVGSCRIDNSKGQVDRMVFLSPDLLISFELWQCACPKQPFLFPSATMKGPLSRRQAERLMRHYLQMADLSLAYTPHSLR
jgi:site-specific recombinase XerD